MDAIDVLEKHFFERLGEEPDDMPRLMAEEVLHVLDAAGFSVVSGPVFDFGDWNGKTDAYLIACLNRRGYTVSKPI